MSVADARAIAEELRERGFEVTLSTNLESASLDRVPKEFYAIQGADSLARLFLWFAGHGHTINGERFLIPTDAPPATDPAR
ncbi:MAG: caspase family protein [Alphaproteobacteria bacterium]|nr:caspase family protein [Alphaproteobacteria bacterium]